MSECTITSDAVKKVCRDIGLADWTRLKDGAVTGADAAILRQAIGGEALLISVETFHQALEVELEHGMKFPDTNVTSNHPLLTAKIVQAHLKEGLDYYQRLICMELEMEVSAAKASGDVVRAEAKRTALEAARNALSD